MTTPESERAGRPGFVGRALLVGASAVVVMGALGLGLYAWRQNPDLFGGSAPPPVLATEAETAARTALTVSVAGPVQHCFQDRIRIGGTIAPREEVEVRPDSEGMKVLRVMAEPLAEVQAGQVLAQLLPADGRTTPVPLRAPVAGTIGRSGATVGTLAAAAAPPLFQIATGGELELVADVDGDLVGRLAPGQTVQVAPVGLAPLQGRVRTVSRLNDPATQLGRARISLPANAGLRWGVYARGTVTVAERCGLGIPFSALLRGPDVTAVYVARSTMVEARPVTTGLSSGALVEIRSGLGAGDMVVQQAGSFLREGDVVRTVPVRTAAR